MSTDTKALADRLERFPDNAKLWLQDDPGEWIELSVGEIRAALRTSPVIDRDDEPCGFCGGPRKMHEGYHPGIQHGFERASSGEPEQGAALTDGDAGAEKPKVVTLSGSRRRAGRAFIEHDTRLTLEGCIVLSIDDPTNPECGVERTEAVKAKLDELHFRKIDLSDEVLVLNVGGYIGDSTRNEIAYAEKVGVPVSYLEPLADALEGKETQHHG